MACWGYIDAVNVGAAPHLAREFGLDDSGIAAAFGWTALGALATFPIARAADRQGRRRVLLLSVALLFPMVLVTTAATALWVFVLAQVAVQALKGVLMTLTPVMVAEALPTDRRAWGQAMIGITGTLGAGLAIIVVAACSDLPGSWRWGWGAAVLWVGVLPFARRSLRESRHFVRALSTGETTESRARELFGPRYRVRTLGVLAVGAFFTLSVAGTQAWVIYHPVRNLGMEQWAATAVMICGGAFSLLGFPIGGRLAEVWGRRATFSVAGLAYVVAALGFYRVSDQCSLGPALGLGVAFAAMALTSAAATVPMRSVATELFPTRLRGAASGLIAVTLAGAAVVVNFGIALLSRLSGGLAQAASVMACAMLLAVVAFLVLPETRGLELEEAALDV